MVKKPLGLDGMDIHKTICFGDYLADCSSQFSLNTMTGFVSAIMYFYADKIGAASVTAAYVLLAAKIVDAFTYPIMNNGKSAKVKYLP